MSISRLRDAIRLGSSDPWADSMVWGGGKGSPAPPPAPDYAGAAVAGQKSQMSSQYTPYGNQVYSTDSNSPSGYKMTTDLTPQAQNTLDIQQGLSDRSGQMAQDYLKNVNTGPMDLSSVKDVSDRAYAQQTSRLDPQWASRDESQSAALRNQGLVAGDQAYDSAMRDYNYGKNDAYAQARTQADATMPQTYQLESSIYNQPLNYENAIRSGAQIQNPQFTQTPGANYLGAAQSQSQYDMGLYNAQVGQQNSMMSGLFGLGQAGLGAYGTYAGLAAMSDRRLKSNIERIGTHPLGIGIYEYDIFGRHTIGVMADEVVQVKPEAVITRPDGYQMVNYGLL